MRVKTSVYSFDFKSAKSNHRPIQLLSTMSTVFEANWHLFTHSSMSKWTKVEDRENLKKYSVCTRNKTSFSVNSVAYAFSQCLYWKSGSVRNSPIFISIIFVNVYFQQILFISTGKSTIFIFICYIF